jgi:hypothetical protein
MRTHVPGCILSFTLHNPLAVEQDCIAYIIFSVQTTFYWVNVSRYSSLTRKIKCVTFIRSVIWCLRIIIPVFITVKCIPSPHHYQKAIPATGRGGPSGCETSRFPHFIDNRLTDGVKVVSPTRRPPFTRKNIPRIFLVLISVRGWVDPRARVWLEGYNGLIGKWTRDLPACSIVP